MNEPISRTPGSSETRAIARQKASVQQAKQVRQSMRQSSAKAKFSQWAQSGFNIVSARRKFKDFEEIRHKKADMEKTKEKEAVKETTKLEESANEFNRKNPELDKRSLLSLAKSITDQDTVDEILRKVLEYYPDYSLADEAFDFLLETSKEDRFRKIQEAKDELNRLYKREIVAGKNIKKEATEFSKAGLGSPMELRNMYRDITGNPRSPQKLFEELTSTYTFQQMIHVIAFMLHALGADLKSKGPSISRGELHRLVDDTRTLQAILGVYRFFGSRMKMISSQFEKSHLSPSNLLNFENLAKSFMNLVSERYVATDKILRIAKRLNLSDDTKAQIILFTQIRDAIRQVAPKLYKSQKHKEELLLALLDILEELEEELEEDGENEEEEEENE